MGVTAAPTATPEGGGEDDEDFRYRGRKRWTCKNFLKGRNMRRVKNKCKKRHSGKKVCDFCSETCGKKAGIGPCAHLKTRKSGQKMSSNSLTTVNARAESGGMSLVKMGTQTGRTETNFDNIFNTNDSSTSSTNRSGNNNSENWLNFKNQMHRRNMAEELSELTYRGNSKFRRIVQERMKQN